MSANGDRTFRGEDQSSGSLALTVPPELVEAIAQRTAELLSLQSRPAPEPPTSDDGRLALTRAEAAERLGMSPDSFERHVQPEIQLVRRGRLRLVPVAELEAWLERNSARALESR